MKYNVKSGDEVVVTGVSGKYPESENIEELSYNLYNGIDMVTRDERRWPRALFNCDIGVGKLKELTKFDANFFKVDKREADLMDAQLRIMLELTYEAIWDSGTDPNTMSGSNTGVFIGNCYDEYITGYSVLGICPEYRQKVATIISEKFNFTGPAIVTDTACASSFSATNEALTAMRYNQCDSAILAGINLGLNPALQYQFYKLNMLSKSGHCRCLDAKANGYAKGESLVVMFLQRKSVAKRIYVEIVNTNTNNDGYEELGITFPTWKTQSTCMKRAYDDCGIDPNELDYVEAHCTGTQAGDPQEMRAICDAMCDKRTPDRPLMIGASKSNFGHTEATSGLAALSKTILTLENSLIPKNLHFEKMNERIEGLVKGIIVPINKNTPFNGDIVGLNNFGFGGSNVVVIVKSPKIKPNQQNSEIFEKIPRLVFMCGRSEQALDYFFNNLLKNKNKITRDSLALINDISKTSPYDSKADYEGMKYRGFALLENTEYYDITAKTQIQKVSKSKPQLWYVCSGMGTQWSAMAKSLLKLEVFAKSILKSCRTLNSHGIDLWKLLTNETENISDSSLNCFVTIASIQIALIDLLNELDIKPDRIIGHSIGELVCAYADGCLTAEETIAIAYWRGRIVEECVPKNGMMAAVGLGFNAIKNICPNGVYIACDNSDDSVVISGEKSLIHKFVKDLDKNGINTQIIESGGIAFNSPNVQSVSSNLLNRLRSIINSKRNISSKWLSTTYSAEKAFNSLTANYFVDNLLQPVLFNNALKQIPNDAVVIEISPHNSLQIFIKEYLGENIVYIPLMEKNSDNMNFTLTRIGKLYSLGLNPKIENLYPLVKYPVSTGTLMLSPLIKWKHDRDWTTIKYPEFFTNTSSSTRYYEVDILDKQDRYLAGHVIDGKNIYPAIGYLWCAWRLISGYNLRDITDFPIEFTDIRIFRASFIPKDGKFTLKCQYSEVSGDFSISESKTVVMSGKMFPLKDRSGFKYQNLLQENEFDFSEDSNNIIMKKKDIYKELRLRGYDYKGIFQGLSKTYRKNNMTFAEIDWEDNFVSFGDSMLHIIAMMFPVRGMFVPISIGELRCDMKIIKAEADKYNNKLGKTENTSESVNVADGSGGETLDTIDEITEQKPVEKAVFNAIYDLDLNVCLCKGFELNNLRATLQPRNVNAQKPIVETYCFEPFFNTVTYDKENFLFQYSNECDKIANEVVKKYNLKIVNQSKSLKTKIIDYKKCIDFDIHDDKDGSNLNIERRHVSRYLKGYYDESEVTHSTDPNAKSGLAKFFDMDHMMSAFDKIEFIEPIMMIAYENILKTELKIVEITEGNITCYPTVLKCFAKYDYGMRINYCLYHPIPEDINKESFEELEIKELDTNDSIISKDIPNEDLDVIIFKDISVSQFSTKPKLNSNQTLENIYNKIKWNGFLVILCRDSLTYAEEVICNIMNVKTYKNRKQRLIEKTQKKGFVFIAENQDLFSANALLFRKIKSDIKIENQIFININNDLESWISRLQTELKSIDDKPEHQNIWLIGNDKPTNGIMGFFNCLRREPKGDRVRVIFNFNKEKNNFLNNLNKNNLVLKEIISKDLKTNVLHNEKLGNFQFKSIEKSIDTLKPSEHCFLNVSTKGDLSSFKWFESQHKYWPIGRKGKQVLCRVYYSSLNFKDVMLATGRIPPDSMPGQMGFSDCVLGLEFSGKDENGNRVMAIVPSKSLATTCIVDDIKFLWPVPDHWTLEDAATVPVVYATALYALIIRGKLRYGEKVLIHSGSGGVGQAAIRICLKHNCDIFVTVGSEEKRNFLKELFPSLTDRNFSCSRDLSFKAHVLSQTNGLGVDIVLNSLSDDKLKASVECLATNGRFLEIGKFDSFINNKLDLSEMILNKQFHGIHLDTLFDTTYKTPNHLLRDIPKIWHLINEGIKDGTVKPLNRTIFASNECEKAFRYMASGKHTGKVIMKIRDEEVNEQSVLLIPAIAKTVFYPNKSYIVTGGLGGMGLELINWMIERGAKNFVVTSRTGPKEPYQFSRLKYFEYWDAKVVIFTEDISELSGTERLVEKATDMAPLGGIFHLAMVMSDAAFENQTIETFNNSCKPKSDSLTNLDIITRKYFPNLDYFVAYSSMTSSRGNQGQTNYGWSNSLMDRICDLRRMDGLHGLALHWGLIGDVGYVVETFGDRTENIFSGTVPQRTFSVLSTLDRFLQTDYSICTSFVKSDQKLGQKGSEKDLMKKIAHILGVDDLESMDPNTKLVKLGMDSLMGVEIKQTLERDYGTELSAQEVRDLSIAEIKCIASGGKIGSKNTIERSEIIESKFQIPEEDVKHLNSMIDGKPIFYLPQSDGSLDIFEPIAKALKRPVYALNWTKDCLEIDSIENLAKYYVSLIDEKFPKLEREYDLIGYSFGGNIAFQISLIIQNESNKIPKLILLDTSPVQLGIAEKQVKISNFPNPKDDDTKSVYNYVSYLAIYQSIQFEKIEPKIRQTPESERVNKTAQLFLEISEKSFDIKGVEFAVESYKRKVSLNDSYTPSDSKFEGSVLLIKAKNSFIKQYTDGKDVTNDYGINQFLKNECNVCELDGGHESFVKQNVDSISLKINEFL